MEIYVRPVTEETDLSDVWMVVFSCLAFALILAYV